ncbi:MAG TPA: efflux RND transporter periplasmic adaptor subunit [Vicinamibacterales bacterium]|nr:efflux RND transporter periplasmic adaptor subunit [Vicinamibacterales bacterium]
MQNRSNRYFLVTLLLVAAAGCGGGEGAAGAPGGASGGRAGGMPAMGVQVVTLEAKPVEQMTEFIGTIKSRQSTTIQPQVEGFITRIRVKSGDRVRTGATLMDIDSRVQQASLQGLESVKSQREIDVTYARQEAERAALLLKAGAASQMDADRATNALKGAEAQLRTVEEQLRTSRADLTYYRVTAPSGGIVGDIPVREGDRVTKTTLLTTIDANVGLEVYLNVPVQQATLLKQGLTVRIVDETGAPRAEEKITFISPSVDTETQTVLVKTPVTVPGTLRTDQYVRAQVIWSTEPGLTIPLTSVTRINGQWFAFVAEPGEGGKGLIARQRIVTLGPVVGNDYTVINGLQAGEKLIAAGIQKIRDGAPVQATAKPSAANATPYRIVGRDRSVGRDFSRAVGVA